MRIGIIDYGMGNLRSVERALQKVAPVEVEVAQVQGPAEILRCDALVLPGVGHFGAATANLRASGAEAAVRDALERGTPLLGVCLGMQLLFEESEEAPGPAARGLGWFPGRVRRFPKGLKVPHMGWNTLESRNDSPLLEGLGPEPYVYFLHSYYVDPVPSGDGGESPRGDAQTGSASASSSPATAESEVVAATTEYGLRYASVVWSGHVGGVQFHPEKSGATGLAILRNFVRWVLR